MKTYFFIIIFLLSGKLFAHQDRILDVSEEGKISGLPDQYLPARLDLKHYSIELGNRRLNMPRCVSKYFEGHTNYKLMVTSSWYQQRSMLPPYINIGIKPEEKDFEYSLLFSLEDLKVIEFTVITHEDEFTTSYHSVKINQECMKEIDKSYESTKSTTKTPLQNTGYF